ncbi:MAG TPA: hypothetical protein VMX17_09625 [Candidatus Glassbacteria bacterium]|nr:hypothetical protein [Candidatus Glassbacteria bacterium]
MAKKRDLTGKFIIAFDTLADGHQCATNDKGKPDPELFDSEADAMFELFADAISMLEHKSEEELIDCGITVAQRDEMNKIFDEGNGDPQHMTDFLDANPECNYNDEFIVPADEFIFGRKAIYGKDGLKIIGQKL